MFHFNAPKVEFLSNQSSPYSLFKQENKIPLQLLIFQSRFQNCYREPPTLCSKGFSWLVPSCFSDLSSKSRESECLADPSPSYLPVLYASYLLLPSKISCAYICGPVFGYLFSLGYKCKEVVFIAAAPRGPLLVPRTQ